MELKDIAPQALRYLVSNQPTSELRKLSKDAHGFFQPTATASELTHLIHFDTNPTETKAHVASPKPGIGELKTVIAKFFHDANKPAQNFYMILASCGYRKNRGKDDDSKTVYQPTIGQLIDQLKTQIIENRASVQAFYHGFPFKDLHIFNTVYQRYLGQYDQLEEWLQESLTQSGPPFDPATLPKAIGPLKELNQANIEFADQVMSQIG